MASKKPCLPDYQTLYAMGYDENGVRVGCSSVDGYLKTEIKKNLRILDEQQFIHRYKWYNLPPGLSQDIIERILYYRGTGVLFYSKELERFFFLPYTNSTEIDCYGRYKDAIPLPFTGASQAKDENGKLRVFLPGLKLQQKYDVAIDDVTIEDVTMSAIPLFDYTKQLSQVIIPRQQLSEAILDMEADIPCYMKTALMNATGIEGVRTGSQDESADVFLCSMAIDRAAKNQQKFVPLVGNSMEFQELTSGEVAKTEEFALAMETLDNFRKTLLGLSNEGLFQTKAHELQSQFEMSAASASAAYQDGLYNRQTFCNIVNSFYPLGIWCDAGEQALGIDKDMDGDTTNDVDQSGAGNEAPEGVNEDA